MLKVEKNPFKGLNPFLMSFLQNKGTDASPSSYPSFHSLHIAHITDFLNRSLPPEYIALAEPSLQIQSKETWQDEFRKDSKVIPDITIYKPHEGRSLSSQYAASPSLEIEMDFEEQRELMSVVIREFRASEHKQHGAAIARIELLSPANMLGESYAEVYIGNRQKAILSNTSLLEIDYLHEYRSPVPNLPPYPEHPQAHAYNIALSQLERHKVSVYFWGINEPIPNVFIPLKGDDSIVFDFNEPYNYTWESSRFWFYLDYSQEPERFETYRESDQAKIREVMTELINQKS